MVLVFGSVFNSLPARCDKCSNEKDLSVPGRRAHLGYCLRVQSTMVGRKAKAEGTEASGHSASATRKQRGVPACRPGGQFLCFVLYNSGSLAPRMVPLTIKISLLRSINIIKIIPPRCSQSLTLI